MTDSKPVNGIICIPIPPLTEGEHTLSTTYEDAEYQSANKCFRIKVASANAVVTADRSTANPNCTVNLVAHLTNSLDMPIVGTKVRFSIVRSEQNGFNGSLVSRSLITSYGGEATAAVFPLGVVTSDNEGIVSLPVTIPTNIRAGLIKVKVEITQSPEGYTNGGTVLLPLYIKRDAHLELGVYPMVDGVYSSTSLSDGDTVDDGTNLRLISTLSDGSDSGSIPIPDVPVSMKVNGITVTADKVEGELDLTNANGQVGYSPVHVDFSQNTFTVNAKNADYPYIGTDEVTYTFNVKEDIIFSNFRDASDYAKDHLRYVFRIRDKRGQPITSANSIVKVAGNTMKDANDNPMIWHPDSDGFVTMDYQITTDMNANIARQIAIVTAVTGMKRHDYTFDKQFSRKHIKVLNPYANYLYDPDNNTNFFYVQGQFLTVEKNLPINSTVQVGLKVDGVTIWRDTLTTTDNGYTNENVETSRITYNDDGTFVLEFNLEDTMILSADKTVELIIGETNSYEAFTQELTLDMEAL